MGSIALAALMTSLGAEPEEIDECVEILTMFPNPDTYVGIVQQAKSALTQLRSSRQPVDVNGGLPVPGS